MPKLYLLGGENVFKRSAKQVNERAFQDAGENPIVAVFPWARSSFDKKYRKRQLLTDYFISLGASAINFIDYSDSNKGIAQNMVESNLVYLTGGLANVLVERLQSMGVDRLLHSYKGVIIGRSAGALALCRRCITTCHSSSKVKTISGLGLADLTLKAHYKPEKDGVLERLSKQGAIYAVPEGSALVYNNGVCSFIGEVYFFENGVKCRL